MTRSPSAEDVAGKLTAARKAMVLALPADGGWGTVPSRSVAKRAWWNIIPPLIDRMHCPKDANEWALTTFGLEVRAKLARILGVVMACDNPPAFPQHPACNLPGDVPQHGMTLRDWFAGQAISRAWDEGDTAADVARSAYYIADAMLAARLKEGEG